MVADRVSSIVTQRHVRHVDPVLATHATGLVAEVYRQVAEEMRLVIPPAMLHSPSPEVLAAYWALIREPLMPPGRAGRLVKEAVAAAVAVASTCPYCTDMHTVGLYELSGERDAEAIGGDHLGEITDARLRQIVAWARGAHRDGGPPLPPGIAAAERAELIGVVVGFHYLSRMVNVFLTGSLLPPRLSPRSRRRLKRGLSYVMKPSVRGDHPAGRANGLLPPAPPRPDLAWAGDSPVLADAVARAFGVFELAGERSLDVAVRRLVLDRLDDWAGEDTGLSTGWCEDLVGELPPAPRAAARLALLTALASHQVTDRAVEEFRRHHPGDRRLIDATAWASAAAAARVGARHNGAVRADTA
ncbi:alkyl hydroperoxide reductase AhpD [Actinoplanes cyaneus]|uniref:Alkyl hydroperoxide reductase AhpD n=1 Tax=Actinoplanes cyaneus TaxID=52696 RepID=A0A919ISN5_9ACTN|nr:carboxymuconolactone decarboxylase family protein [Actinoplanes cyaneus]MCW2138173.1 alkylhydroperoxidase AhpD family core domain-containing protein [Actinoplanes cyaneus]GID70531.1 alkyl hydroperoxide reductase AhpD [Actinoplanes cyaneus]